MKKIYFPTFICLLFVFVARSQSTYYKMLKEDTTTWQHFGVYMGVKAAFSSTMYPYVGNNSVAAIDSITILGIKYKKLYQAGYNGVLDYSFKSLMGYLREDTVAKKVYFRNLNGSEFLLYNFSMNVYDSTYILFPNLSSSSGYYRVDSIVTRNELQGPRKHFYLRKHVNNWSPSSNYFDMIESVGCSNHLLFLYTHQCCYSSYYSTNQACQHPWEVGVACKKNDLSKQFQSCTYTSFFYNWFTPHDSCNYYYTTGSLKDNDRDQIINLGPNPCDERLIIKISKDFENISVTISDMSGKVLADIKSRILVKDTYELITKDLAPGIYIVKIKLNETVITRPIIIQH